MAISQSAFENPGRLELAGHGFSLFQGNEARDGLL